MVRIWRTRPLIVPQPYSKAESVTRTSPRPSTQSRICDILQRLRVLGSGQSAQRGAVALQDTHFAGRESGTMTCTDFARERETCVRLVYWLGMIAFFNRNTCKLERLFARPRRQEVGQAAILGSCCVHRFPSGSLIQHDMIAVCKSAVLLP